MRNRTGKHARLNDQRRDKSGLVTIQRFVICSYTLVTEKCDMSANTQSPKKYISRLKTSILGLIIVVRVSLSNGKTAHFIAVVKSQLYKEFQAARKRDVYCDKYPDFCHSDVIILHFYVKRV